MEGPRAHAAGAAGPLPLTGGYNGGARKEADTRTAPGTRPQAVPGPDSTQTPPSRTAGRTGAGRGAGGRQGDRAQQTDQGHESGAHRRGPRATGATNPTPDGRRGRAGPLRGSIRIHAEFPPWCHLSPMRRRIALCNTWYGVSPLMRQAALNLSYCSDLIRQDTVLMCRASHRACLCLPERDGGRGPWKTPIRPSDNRSLYNDFSAIHGFTSFFVL